MELLINPLLDSELSNLLQVAKLRPEGQPAQDVDCLFVGWKLLIEADCASDRKRGRGDEQYRNAAYLSQTRHGEGLLSLVD